MNVHAPTTRQKRKNLKHSRHTVQVHDALKIYRSSYTKVTQLTSAKYDTKGRILRERGPRVYRILLRARENADTCNELVEIVG